MEMAEEVPDTPDGEIWYPGEPSADPTAESSGSATEESSDITNKELENGADKPENNNADADNSSSNPNPSDEPENDKTSPDTNTQPTDNIDNDSAESSHKEEQGVDNKPVADDNGSAEEESAEDTVDGVAEGSGGADGDADKTESEADSGPQRVPVNDLETINQKRQEELETFQRLIDDITRLEHELESKNSSYNELQTKIDVMNIALDTAKEKAEDASSEVKELEKKLSDTESHLSRVQKEKAEMENRDEHGSSTAATAAALHHTHALTEDENVRHEAEMKELREKIRRLTEAGEEKDERLARLETELSEQRQLVERVEASIGHDKLNSLRNNEHGNGAALSAGKGQERREQAVTADVKGSKTCSIM